MKARRIEVKLSDERLITPSGLSTVGEILNGSDLNKNINALSNGKRSKSGSVVKIITNSTTLIQGSNQCSRRY